MVQRSRPGFGFQSVIVRGQDGGRIRQSFRYRAGADWFGRGCEGGCSRPPPAPEVGRFTPQFHGSSVCHNRSELRQTRIWRWLLQCPEGRPFDSHKTYYGTKLHDPRSVDPGLSLLGEWPSDQEIARSTHQKIHSCQHLMEICRSRLVALSPADVPAIPDTDSLSWTRFD